MSEVLTCLEGKLLSKNTSEELCFSGLATDSRKVKEDYLFFPLVGQQDGHKFIDSAISNGASCVFVNEFYADTHRDEIKKIISQNVTVISVSHTMYALQALAGLYVSKFPDLIKVGVTGSSGKTTTKEIAVKVLSQKYSVIYNEGNLNSETGLPLSVFNIRKNHQLGIFEMGMNRKGEIAELASVLKPSYGIITNIGSAHIGILGSRQNIAAEKKEIFRFFNSNCRGYIPADDDFVDFLSNSKGEIKKYSFDQISDIQDLGLKGSSFVFEGEKINFPLCGKYNLKNCLGVIQLAKDLGLSAKEIKAGIESVQPLFGRNQIFEGNVTIVQDCYNANPDSMSASVDFFDSVKWEGKKVFVLGSMLELGDESEEEHKKIVR
ncbi:MAG: UDP-N-acetylmuramoyl-tripeptide--D-alanyl-D-alanine ligase, partial [Treponemataceae bacterium]|nr:UDP-N-acetylmuramoyl-tripeptide--D-alanyl-D-alanine ligase [Treponemataceae bacterium]